MISEKKFIELLNLYLDHETSAEQVRVLEAEIRRDPARHTLYRQYCAMHRGCLELGSAFAPRHEHVPEIRPPAAAREFLHVLRPAGFGWGAWASGVGLAAACGALAFFVFSNNEPSGGHPRAFDGQPGWAAGTASAPAVPSARLSAPTVLSAPVGAAQVEPQGQGRALLPGGRAASPGAAPAQSPAVFATTVAGPLAAGHPHLSNARSALGPAAAPAVFATAAVGPFAAAQVLAVPASGRPAAATPASRFQRLHAVYSPGFPRSQPEARAAQPFSLFYVNAPVAATGHLEWGPLVNIDAIRAETRPQPPSFQVQPAVAPSLRPYRHQESSSDTDPAGPGPDSRHSID